MTENILEKSTIENHLQSLFTPQIRRRGLDIANNKGVSEAYFDESTSKIKSMVKASDGQNQYQQVIVVHPTNRFRSSATCTCPYNSNCKHAAAVLYHILNHSIDVIDESDESAAGILEKGSHHFRYLPAGENVTQLLNKYSYRNNDLYIQEHTLKFNPDNSIHFIGSERKPYYAGGGLKEVANVIINRKDNAIGVKCNSCQSATQKLCKHQKVALEHFSSFVDEEAYLNGILDYEKEMESFAEQMNIPVEILKESFEPRFKYSRLVLHKTNEALYDSEDLKRLQKKVNRLKVPMNDDSESSVEMQDRMTNGLLWTNGAKEDRLFYLLEGRLNKQGDRISAKLQLSPYPSFLGQQEIDQYIRLTGLQFGSSLKKYDIYENVKNYILQNTEDVNNIIHYLDEHDTVPEINKNGIRLFRFSPKVLTVELYINKHPLGYSIRPELMLDRKVPVLPRNAVATPLFLLIDDIAYCYESPSDYLAVSSFLDGEEILFNKSDREEVLQLVENFTNITDVNFEKEMEIEKSNRYDGKRTIYLKEVSNFIVIEPYIEFEDCKFNVLTQQQRLINDTLLHLNEEERQEFLEILRNLHPNFNIHHFVQDYLFLNLDEVLHKLWFLEFYEACRVNDIEVFGQEQLTKLNFSPYRAQVSNFIKSGIDWFDVEVDMTFGDQKVGVMDWVKAIKDNQKYVKLDDGTLGLIPEEWLEKLKRIVQSAEIDKDGVRISKFKFNVIDELFDNIDDQQVLEELREKKHMLLSYDYRQQFDLPETIEAELRPYQESGYQWLRTLHEIGWGGILADDMGLGKTLQVISLLTDIHKYSQKCSLIVVPRSLIFNWVNELDKFSPNLKYLVHYGTDRKVDEQHFYEYDLVITTYTLVANDIKELNNIQFEYIILDESQAIKNVTSQRYRSVCVLKGKNRICMTGTPIENNTFELYAQMNFANPGMLGSQKAFKDMYAQPIDMQGDQDAAKVLKKIINPFLLRRTKEVVAKDLPEKTETIIYCEMGKAQRKIYDEIKSQIRDDIKSKVAADGINRSKMKILEGLLRLRQVCNSPLLVKQDLPKNQQESIKIDTLVEQLTEDLNDHNALVFSQFTSMLDLIRKELDARNIRYAYLDGSTRKRKEVVEEFDQNDDIKIFLISLKAGNTGLNLVKADYVYIVDPWWNPAVEAQAIDRTHRIGQDKNIFAYKLVCKDTIEEKILKLQERKKKVATDIISAEENFMKTLNKDELMGLFE